MTLRNLTIELTSRAEGQYKKLIKSGQKKALQKVIQIFEELETNPRTGIGRPERLKHKGENEVWSREIDKKNRLVYIIDDEKVTVLVISVLGHYEDK